MKMAEKMGESEQTSPDPRNRRRRLSVNVIDARDALHDSAVANSSQKEIHGPAKEPNLKHEGSFVANSNDDPSSAVEVSKDGISGEIEENDKTERDKKTKKAKMKTPEEVRLELKRAKENITKRVKWGSVHFRTYKVGIGSGVPANGGPSVGLVGAHVSEEQIPLDVYESTKSVTEKYHRDGIVSAMERTWWLKKIHRKQSIDQEKVLVSLKTK